MNVTRRNFIGAGAAFAALAGRGLTAAQGVGLATGVRRLRIGIVSDIHVTSEEVAQRFRLALEHFRSIGVDGVCITGGEPLLQKDAVTFMGRLLEAGHEVLLETGGHISVADVPGPVVRIVDVKCPGSGEASKMHWPNLDLLQRHDEVKFVIRDRADYEYARDVVARHQLAGRVAAVLFSPVHGVLDPQALAAWILEDRLTARLALQLHKYVWSPETRGV
jgi:7-carboxy-7-deazaguanine synthase